MKLPNAQLATVPEPKITQYLLNLGHPIGGSKAALFLRHGFTVEDWRRLLTSRNQLLFKSHGRTAQRHSTCGFWRCSPDLNPLGLRLEELISRLDVEGFIKRVEVGHWPVASEV